MFSKRIRNVEPSATVQLSNKVKRLKNQGLDILSFTLGEPDFNTPQHIIDAAKKALDEVNDDLANEYIKEHDDRHGVAMRSLDGATHELCQALERYEAVADSSGH